MVAGKVHLAQRSLSDERTNLHDHGARGAEGLRGRRGHDDGRPGGVVRETAGFGVLDIGATETVGSLEAFEKLCQLRGPHHAKEMKVIPHGQKSFRFGNNQVQRSESYIRVPQQVGQQ